MRIRLLFTALSLIISGQSVLHACSCIYEHHYCSFIQEPEIVANFKAVVIRTVEYSFENHAAYLKIVQVAKAPAGMRDTVKIYGSAHEADCSIRIKKTFYPGDTVLVAISDKYPGQPIVNPDSLSENYTEFRQSICWSVVLIIRNAVVQGKIAPGIRFYPAAAFETDLMDCAFRLETAAALNCVRNKYILSPNPADGGTVRLTGKYPYLHLEAVRIFDMNGRLVREHGWQTSAPVEYLEFTGLSPGMYVVEITCQGQRQLRRLVVGR